MTTRVGLLFGPIAALALLLTLIVLPPLVPGYDQVRQTVSEIGEAGSPARWPFTIALAFIGLCLLVFAASVWTAAPEGRRARAGAVLVGVMAIAVGGVGWFAHPHALHNVFGQTELAGFLAPLAFALARPTRSIALVSWIAFAALWASVFVNLAYLGLLGEGASAPLQALLTPVYGLVQRSLFVIWFAWCAAAGLLLRRPSTQT